MEKDYVHAGRERGWNHGEGLRAHWAGSESESEVGVREETISIFNVFPNQVYTFIFILPLYFYSNFPQFCELVLV